MSRESYIRGFCKAAEASGVDPVSLAKMAKDFGSFDSLADGYFNYGPKGVDDIYFQLNPELEQTMADYAAYSNPGPRKVTGTLRRHIPRENPVPKPAVRKIRTPSTEAIDKLMMMARRAKPAALKAVKKFAPAVGRTALNMIRR